MAHYKAADSKREQFRRYLEKSGVLDTLTKGARYKSCAVRAPETGKRALKFLANTAWEGFMKPNILYGLLVALYEEPEKPNSALDFLKHHLGASAPENPEIEALRLEVAEMKEKYEAVLEENKNLKTKLAQYEPPQEEKHDE